LEPVAAGAAALVGGEPVGGNARPQAGPVPLQPARGRHRLGRAQRRGDRARRAGGNGRCPAGPLTTRRIDAQTCLTAPGSTRTLGLVRMAVLPLNRRGAWARSTGVAWCGAGCWLAWC